MLTELSPADDEITRKITSIILQRLAEEGQNSVAEAVGLSETSVSRLKAQVTETVRIMRVLGFKVVPLDHMCFRAQDIQPYFDLAKQHMNRIDCASELAWEEGLY